MDNIAFKTDLLRGAKGEKGDAGSTESVPTDGVLAYVGETTPQGYEEIEVSDVFTDIYAEIDAVKDIVSDAYDVTSTYAVGDYCIYNDTLYKCNTAIVTPEAFTPAKWTATNVGDEIKSVNEELNKGSVFVNVATSTTYAQALTTLYNSIDWNKITNKSVLIIDGDTYTLGYFSSYYRSVVYGMIRRDSVQHVVYNEIGMDATTKRYSTSDTFTAIDTDNSNTYPAAQRVITLYY